MEDKEVGELWRLANDMYVPDEFLDAEQNRRIMALIRKLVEERAAHLFVVMQDRYEMQYGPQRDACLEVALRDFCIDPETWK